MQAVVGQLVRSDSVQHVPTSRIGRVRMIEIIRGRMDHADSFHHTTGPLVLWNRKRDNLGQVQALEAEDDGGTTALGRVAVAPMFDRESPTNLDTRREMRLKRRNREAHEPCKRYDTRNLDGPQTKAVVIEVPFNAIDQSIALVASEHAMKVLHDAWVGIHGGEHSAICGNPSPEKQPARSHLTRPRHF